MRLDKWICHSTGLSRPQVQRAVRGGQVTVNGLMVKKADWKLDESDTVTLDGSVVAIPKPRYFMLYKPEGYVCANTDGSHPVVLDLLDEDRLDELQIAGRLDIDTTGLVLITDDGQWNHRVTAPSRLCKKTYHVFLCEPLSAEAAELLRKGVQLHGEKKLTQTAELVFAAGKTDEMYLTIQEGKYHQVKRMFAAVNNLVVKLHRQRIGDILLDTALQPGDYRTLTDDEVASFR